LASCRFGRLFAIGSNLIGLSLGRGALLLGGIDCFTLAVLCGFARFVDLLLGRGLGFLTLLDCIVTRGF
jgi:hypothetical protein